MKTQWKALLASIVLLAISWDKEPGTVDVLEESSDGVTWAPVYGPYNFNGVEFEVVVETSGLAKFFRVVRLTADPPVLQ